MFPQCLFYAIAIRNFNSHPIHRCLYDCTLCIGGGAYAARWRARSAERSATSCPVRSLLDTSFACGIAQYGGMACSGIAQYNCIASSGIARCSRAHVHECNLRMLTTGVVLRMRCHSQVSRHRIVICAEWYYFCRNYMRCRDMIIHISWIFLSQFFFSILYSNLQMNHFPCSPLMITLETSLSHRAGIFVDRLQCWIPKHTSCLLVSWYSSSSHVTSHSLISVETHLDVPVGIICWSWLFHMKQTRCCLRCSCVSACLDFYHCICRASCIWASILAGLCLWVGIVRRMLHIVPTSICYMVTPGMTSAYLVRHTHCCTPHKIWYK